MSTLLASTAESLYWAGRHLERAEDMARIVLVHGDAHVDLPVGEDVGWEPLLAIAGVEELFEKHLGGRHPSGRLGAPRGPREADVAEFLLVHGENPSSISRSVAQARHCLRVTRPAISTEAWEQCNEMWLALADLHSAVPTRQGRVAWLRRVVSDCQRLTASLSRTMRRDGGVAFVRMGQCLERADLVCRVLTVRADAVVGDRMQSVYDQIRAMTVLRSLASYEGSRRMDSSRGRAFTPLGVLLLDEAYPRSVAACLGEIRDQLKDLPNNERALSACSDTLVQLAGASSASATAEELQDFVTEFQPALSTIHEHVATTYFHAMAICDNGDHAPVRPPATVGTTPRASVPQSAERIYRIVHRTVYRYPTMADRSDNEAHLRPRDTERQRCLHHDLVVVPNPRGWWERTDSFGNGVTKFAVDGAFDTLSVTAESRVVVAPTPPPPRSMPWESAVSVLRRDRQPDTRQARRYQVESRLVPSSELITEYAEPSFAPNRPLVAAVIDLCSRIHDDFTYEPGFTSVSTPMLEAFNARKGVCQDFAHVAIACLRSVGLAARYVSGYLETAPPPGQEKLAGADASHAWASTYVPGWGWLDFDPTNDQLVSNRYITVAWGLDYGDVSPLRGIVEGGGPSHELEVAVDVQAEPLASLPPALGAVGGTSGANGSNLDRLAHRS